MGLEMTNSPLLSLPHEQLSVLLRAAEAEQGIRNNRNRLAAYRPYPKQRAFHNAGRLYDERLFMAANQSGKSLSAAAEWATHLTGRYPDWWEGKVFDEPVRFWAAGVTGESTRDNPQRLLVGDPQRREAWGTGFIPFDALGDTTSARGVADLLDNTIVKWGGGGDIQAKDSVLSFKSYEKGRQKWQGETLHGVWFDEEPPLDIYTEGKTRVNAKAGITIITFTPLMGMTETVSLFVSDADIDAMRKA